VNALLSRRLSAVGATLTSRTRTWVLRLLWEDVFAWPCGELPCKEPPCKEPGRLAVVEVVRAGAGFFFLAGCEALAKVGAAAIANSTTSVSSEATVARARAVRVTKND
jgi:hypothetical protein